MTTLQTISPLTTHPVAVRVHSGVALAERLSALDDYVLIGQRVPVSRRPAWLFVLQQAMDHVPYAIEAHRGDRTVGVVFLAYVHSWLFGRYLVSLPYLNSGGILAADSATEASLASRAVALADELGVQYLELRHEWPQDFPAFGHRREDKVHMRLELPTTGAALWEQIPAKVRNQVRKGQKHGFQVQWGGVELVDEFYSVFSRNMRDLGTPTYSRALFAEALKWFPDGAELCVLRDGRRPVAGALLLHGHGVAEVPSASSLREYNSSCANMLLYWHLLERSAERRQELFDFGRSSEGSSTYRFKKQWGATPAPACWQYYVRSGSAGQLRPDNPKYKKMVAIWQHLPLALTRLLGPRIVRGIP